MAHLLILAAAALTVTGLAGVSNDATLAAAIPQLAVAVVLGLAACVLQDRSIRNR